MPSLSHTRLRQPIHHRDRQDVTFIDATSPPSQFFPFVISDKVHPQSLDVPAVPYTYVAQPQPMLKLIPPPGCHSRLMPHMMST